MVARNSFNPPDTPGMARLVDLKSRQTVDSRTLGIIARWTLPFSRPCAHGW